MNVGCHEPPGHPLGDTRSACFLGDTCDHPRGGDTLSATASRPPFGLTIAASTTSAAVAVSALAATATLADGLATGWVYLTLRHTTL